MKYFQSRLGFLLRLYITLMLIFATQKVVFMVVNAGMAGGAPLGSCLAAVWHGLRLDSVMTCYLLVIPAAAVLVSYFLPRLAVRRVLTPYYVIVALVTGIIFVIDTILYLFWGSKLDANDLMYATKPKDMMASLPWWAILLALAVITLVVWHYVRRLRHATPASFKMKASPWMSLVMIPVTGIIFVGLRGGVSESTANPSFAYFSKYPFCNHAALNPTFNMMHSLFKAQDLENEWNVMDEADVDALLDGSFEPDNSITDTLLRMQRPNVVLIIWESGGHGMVMNDSVGRNIMALATEGVYFSNCRADNFRTDRGIVSVLSGWQGLPTASLMKRTDLCRHLPSLAATLDSAGYHTTYTYGGDINFTNKRLYLTETGFAEVRGDDWFPAAYSTCAWGVPDEYLLRPCDLPSQRPFLSVLQTLSSHEPWDVPVRRMADKRQNAFAYTDSCIGVIVDSLRHTPLWDSLLVVIVPDHGATFGDIRASSHPAVSHIPIVWVGGAVREARNIDILMNQSDLAATLLAQMDIDASELVFSRNVLSASYGQRPRFAMHAFRNGLNLFTPDGVSTYDCVERTLTPADKDKQRFVEALLQRIYTTSAHLATR